jgi:hypothetical protein
VSLNLVLNNQPTHAIAVQLDAIPPLLDQTRVGGPPGSLGEQATAVQSQLKAGNPGGVGAAAGLGITIDAAS